MYIHIHTHTK